MIKSKRKPRSDKKAGPEYSVLIKCEQSKCGRGRWVKPQDKHLAKFCKEHQADYTRMLRRERAKKYRLRKKKSARVA